MTRNAGKIGRFVVLLWICKLFTHDEVRRGFPIVFSIIKSATVVSLCQLKCIFVYKRLCETRTGGQRMPAGGIHTTSHREMCTSVLSVADSANKINPKMAKLIIPAGIRLATINVTYSIIHYMEPWTDGPAFTSCRCHHQRASRKHRGTRDHRAADATRKLKPNLARPNDDRILNGGGSFLSYFTRVLFVLWPVAHSRE